jgi:3-oxoadipate enol-lactonase
MPYANSNGTTIYWDEEGTGEPVLLIMGLGYSSAMWHRTRPVLAKHFHVILFDNRGVGASDVPPGPYSTAEMAADAAAVLDAAGVASAHVFGISMGGMIAQEFVLTCTGRVRKLVLGCTACGGPKAVRAERAATDMLLARGAMTPEQAITAAIPFVYHPSTPRERIEEDLEIRRRNVPSADGYLAQLAAILGWQSYDRLGGISAPTLVIHGEADRLVPAGNGRLIAETIPGAQFVLLPNASHMFTTDQPEASHRAILDFLLA